MSDCVTCGLTGFVVCEGSDTKDWRLPVVMGSPLHEFNWLLMVDFVGCGKTGLEISRELLTTLVETDG